MDRPRPGQAIRRLASSAPRRPSVCTGGMLPHRASTDERYFSELLSDANFELSLPPIPFTVEMITSEIPAAISPYSIDVTPDSSARNFLSIFILAALRCGA